MFERRAGLLNGKISPFRRKGIFPFSHFSDGLRTVSPHAVPRRRPTAALRLLLGLLGALALGALTAPAAAAQTAPTLKDAQNAGLGFLVSVWQDALSQSGTAD